MRILILGGTTEARELCELLAGDPRFSVTLSLAGRTAVPAAHPVPTRVGGFGGPDGLAAFLVGESIAALVDATHPYAAGISANAVTAGRAVGTPLGSLLRPPWQPAPGDRWQEAATAADAARALGTAPRRVFLSLGRLDLAAFAAALWHSYVARTIDPPDREALPPDITLLQARGPFALEDEIGLLRTHAIDIVVSKNSGGTATYAKIEAARRLGLPVVMIARPVKPAGEPLPSAAAARSWLERLHGAHKQPRSARGV